jgi:N-acyl-phosphatidylethanolamine-hydrolysing phospholipase D
MAPGVALEDLPPIDLVLLTHDHYDHLDEPTVRRLAAEQAGATWIAPLGMRRWLSARGIRRVHELDWWAQCERDALRITCLPAQHFSGRGVRRNRALWCGWSLEAAAHRVCFAGDTGLHPAFREIGERLGPFDVTILPIGAYDPRWFMAPVHMDPDDAVTAFRELTVAHTKRCRMVGMHWGTFRLTDEPMTEPPQRTRDAWRSVSLPPDDLWILAHGETRWISP